METFYTIFPEIKQQYFDGLIIYRRTSENSRFFEEVDYWPETRRKSWNGQKHM